MISRLRIRTFNGVVAGACVAIGLLLPATAGAVTQQQIDRCVNNGNVFSPDEQISGCTDYIESGQQTQQHLAIAYAKRCRAYYVKGDNDRAISDCTDALRLDPRNVGAYSGRGNAYHGKGDFDRAIADYSDEIQLSPNSGVGFYLRGNTYDAKGNHARAIADYNEAIRINPKDVDAYVGRGEANFYAGSLPKALADLKQASELDPKSTFAALWLDIIDQRSNLPSRLPQVIEQLDMAKWPAPVIRLYLGQMTPEAVLAAADDPDNRIKKRHFCDANFYSGELALQQGAKDDATRLFRLATRDCSRDYDLWADANAELNALGVTP